ncbi:MAG: GGDEF domain-containing protein, partial [Lachnospiraceae bacterium]|nr:GGDEF domain-containing protein [Lachnospiraceae bacterium]
TIIKKSDIVSCSKRDIVVLDYDFKEYLIQGAYAPALEWIRIIYNQYLKDTMTVEELVDSCGVYSLHKKIFITFIKTGIAVRQEEVVFPEIEYEKKYFIRSVINIYRLFGRRFNIMMILNNLNLAGESFLRFLKELLKDQDRPNMSIVGVFNDEYNENILFKSEWNELLEVLNRKNLLFFIDGNNNSYPLAKQEIDINKVFIDFENMYATMAYKQAVVYIERMQDSLFELFSENYKDNLFDIMINCAMCAIYDDNVSEATRLIHLIGKKLSPETNFRYSMKYYHVISTLEMYRHDMDEAIKMAEYCRNYARKTKDEYSIFVSEVLFYKAYYCGWYKIFERRNIYDLYRIHISVTIPEDIINMLKKYSWYNTLAYFYIYSFDMDKKSMDSYANSMSIKGYLKKAIDIAYTLNNMSFVASAYLKKILDFSIDDCKYHEYITFLHERRKSVTDNIMSFSLEEYRYDYLGYQCIIHERYEMAHDYFCDFLEWMYKKKNVEEIAETLYNMSTNAIAAGEYDIACKYLMTTIKIIEYMGVQSLCTCKSSKIFGMLALCYYYLGDEVNCSLYIDRIERMVSHIIDSDNEGNFDNWDDELFLYYYIKAIIHKKSNNISASQLCFSKAEYHMMRTKDYMFFSYPMLALEKADLYYYVGENKKADNIIDKCIEYCSRNGFAKRAMTLSNKKNNNMHTYGNYDFSLKNVTISQIIELARQSEVNVKRIARQKDITFLSDWQDIINKECYSIKQITSEAMNALRTMYKFDGILFAEIVNDTAEILYSDEKTKNGISHIEDIYSFFKICDNIFTTNRSEKIFVEYKTIMQYFDMNNIMVFVGVPIIYNEMITSFFIGFLNTSDLYGYNDFIIDDEELEVIKFVLVQLNIGISKIKKRNELEKINQKLLDMAVKDQLTGLMNRQGFDRALQDVYGNGPRKTLLMYLDLDNFKYYNDTFGHDIGDIVLKRFARILVGVTGNNDIVVRYGGDEFIILMLDCMPEKGERIAGIIAKELSNGFIDDIKEKCGSNISIPKNKLLSCSIGLAYNEKCLESDINNIMLEADEALYYIKDNMKGTCISWNDLKH